MGIENVEIVLAEDADRSRHARLKAFATIQISALVDGLTVTFIIRDAKVIQGDRDLFVGMPSRKVHDHCESCAGKNCLDAPYCNWCGLKRSAAADFSIKRHSDIVFPMDHHSRDVLQEAVIRAYHKKLNDRNF